MGLINRNPNEKIGCVGWVIGGIVLIIAGVVAIAGGLVDAIF